MTPRPRSDRLLRIAGVVLLVAAFAALATYAVRSDTDQDAQVRRLSSDIDEVSAAYHRLAEDYERRTGETPTTIAVPPPDVDEPTRADVERIVTEQVLDLLDAHPELRGRDGKAPSDAELAERIAAVIASRPDLRGEAGRDAPPVTDDDLAPLVAAAVVRHLTANPPPGVTPEMIRAAVGEWLLDNGPAMIRAAVEAWLADHPPPPGPAGEPAPPVTEAEIAAVVLAYFVANPPPAGPAGPPPSPEAVAVAVAAWLDANLAAVVDARLAAGRFVCNPPDTGPPRQPLACQFTPG